jgi:hypothetical protein
MGASVEVIPTDDGSESSANIVELEFRSVRLAGRRVTITMWEQIVEVPLLVNSGELNFTPLGRVNKCKCPKTEKPHAHVLGTVGGNPCKAKMLLKPTDNYLQCHWDVISVAKSVAFLTAISDKCKASLRLWEPVSHLSQFSKPDDYEKTEGGWIQKRQLLPPSTAAAWWISEFVGSKENSFLLRGKTISTSRNDLKYAYDLLARKSFDGRQATTSPFASDPDRWIRYDQVDELRRMCETELSLKEAWTRMLETTGNIHRSLATIDALPQIFVGV